MTLRHPGWTVAWQGRHEVFTAPDGTTYVRTSGPADVKLKAFLAGRTVKLRRYNMDRAQRIEQRRRARTYKREQAAVTRRRSPSKEGGE